MHQTFPLLSTHTIPVFNLDDVFLDETTIFFEKMEVEYKSDYLHKKNVLQNYLQFFLHQIQCKNESVLHKTLVINAAHRTTFLFLESLQQQFSIKSTNEFLKLKNALDFAQRLSVHANHLNHSVKKLTSRTSSQFIPNRIIIEADKLLLDTNWTITNILSDCVKKNSIHSYIKM